MTHYKAEEGQARSGTRTKAACGKYGVKESAFTDDIPTCGKCLAHLHGLMAIAEAEGDVELPPTVTAEAEPTTAEPKLLPEPTTPEPTEEAHDDLDKSSL